MIQNHLKAQVSNSFHQGCIVREIIVFIFKNKMGKPQVQSTLKIGPSRENKENIDNLYHIEVSKKNCLRLFLPMRNVPCLYFGLPPFGDYGRF